LEASTSSNSEVKAIKGRALRGSIAELSTVGGSQVLRLGSNLVLTRMLVPEAFGLASSVSLVLQGLLMLSDMGIAQAVIRSPHGNEPRFYNTAWTLQVIRGAVMCCIGIAIAWPASLFYGEPRIIPLICFSSVQLLIGGFHSTSIYTLRRTLKLGWITFSEIGSQAVNSISMIIWAYFSPTVWCLLVGSVFAVVFRLITTHLAPVQYRNTFTWDADARAEISKIGRWIFGSSAISFFGDRGNSFLFAKFFGMGAFGISSIAITLTDAIFMTASRVSTGVLFPILSRVHNDSTESIRDNYYRYRLRLDAAFQPALGVLALCGGWIIHLLWDSRYSDAGWMLQILCVKVAIGCLLTPAESCLSAMGNTKFYMMRSALKVFWLLLIGPLGYYLDGVRGFLWATAFGDLPTVFVLWPALRAVGVLRIRSELRAVALFLCGAGLGWLLSLVLPQH
jgi:O-antigen/teichoic acid export membrane protein